MLMGKGSFKVLNDIIGYFANLLMVIINSAYIPKNWRYKSLCLYSAIANDFLVLISSHMAEVGQTYDNLKL